MDIRFETEYDPELDCFILLRYRMASGQPGSTVQFFLEQLAKDRNLPIEELQQVAAPAMELETHIFKNLSAPESELKYFFPPAVEQNGEVGLTFWLLHQRGIRFRELPTEKFLEEKKWAVSMIAAVSEEQVRSVTDLESLAVLLEAEQETDHSHRVCMDVFRDPVRYQEKFDRLLDEAVALYMEKRHILPPAEECTFHALRKKMEESSDPIQTLSSSMPDDCVKVCRPTPFLFFSRQCIRIHSTELRISSGVFDDKIEQLIKEQGNLATKITMQLKAMADLRRMELLGALQEGPKRVDDLTTRFSMSPALLSYHLDQLYRVNLLILERQARNYIYRINYYQLQQFISNLQAFLHIPPQENKIT